MGLTKKLVLILVLLIISLTFYLYLDNKEVIKAKINRFIIEYTQNAIIVPKPNEYERNYDYLSVEETNSFKPKNINDLKKIYYTVLNRGYNTFTFYCDVDYDCQEDAKNIAKDDEYLSFINSYVNPYNSYKKYKTKIIGNNQISLEVEKLYTDIEIKQINSIVDNYIKNNISDKDSNLDKIKKIHDFLIINTTYDNNYKKEDKITISNKANGALINKVALCSGYSDAYAIFLDKIGIPNFKVTSDNHVWNAVLVDGKWKHIDVTWDDDEINLDNNYNFYLLTTNELLKKDVSEHTFNEDNYLELE